MSWGKRKERRLGNKESFEAKGDYLPVVVAVLLSVESRDRAGVEKMIRSGLLVYMKED